MNAEQHRFRKRFQNWMRSESADFTNSPARQFFPGTLKGSTGISYVDFFKVLVYMEARFYLLECLDLAQKILGRNLRLGDVNFMLEYGRLPVIKRFNGSQNLQQEDDCARVGSLAASLGRLFQKMAPIVRAIISDHPHRLNFYAYYLITSIFRGATLERLIRQETILFTLILENFKYTKNQKSHPSIFKWMHTTAERLLKLNLMIIEQMQLITTVELMETIIKSPIPGVDHLDTLKLEVHFTSCPLLFQVKELSNELTLRNGMITVCGAFVLPLIRDQFCQILSILARVLEAEKVSRETNINRVLSASVRMAQYRTFKAIARTMDKQEIVSVIQLRREKALLPPCIYVLMEKLEQQNRLQNSDRTYLIIYLINVGMPLKQAEILLRDYYSRNENLTDTWTQNRGGHLRRKYRNEKQKQYGCQKFDRYCIWQRGGGTRQALAKMRNGQQKISARFCSTEVFKELLNSLNKACNSDEARSLCAKLGCFENSTVPFYSPLGYYYNTKGQLHPNTENVGLSW